VTSNAPLVAVALEAGFADQSHFTRAFKRHTGLAPGRYRRELQGP
jgi:AraC-like DNA-binding protein